MKTLSRKAVALLLACALALSLSSASLAAETTSPSLDTAAEKAASYLLSAVSSPTVGSIGGEWTILGLARGSASVPQSYWESYYTALRKYVTACSGILHEKKYTEYSRVVLALTALGLDPRDVGGYDLLAPLGNYEKTVWQGLNGPIWALIALDSGNYAVPTNSSSQATREKYVDAILSQQLSDGGWDLTGSSADPDLTAMALQALAPYTGQSKVRTAVTKALTCLSGLQNSDGSFSTSDTPCCESTAQVVVALTSLGISLRDSRFVKNGSSPLDALLTFQQADGSFLHVKSGSGNDLMATEQGYYALAAAQRAEQGKPSLYTMTDRTPLISTAATAVGLPGKHSDVQALPVTLPGTSFPDIAGHQNQKAIEAMAERGIINGKKSDQFDPDATMTRAEFAAIVVRALGLTPKATNAFSDVPASSWYASYVGTAYTYGIVNGVGNGKFNPSGSITRQEAAVMVARAAVLCGLTTDRTAAAIRDTLAQFSDYTSVSSWAQSSLAFCYDTDILDQSDLTIQPKTAILRCEIAQMLYNLLSNANLL